MAGTFTLTATLEDHGGVPYVDSPITVYAGPTPDTTAQVIYSGGLSGDATTDADGQASIELACAPDGVDLYYRVTSEERLFPAIVLPAQPPGETTDISAWTSYEPGSVTPSVLNEALAARDDAQAAELAAAASAAAADLSANSAAGNLPIQQPFNAAPVSIVSAVQSGHSWTFTGTQGTGCNLNDTGDYALGTQSIKMVTNGGGANLFARRTGLSLDMTNKGFTLWLKVDDTTNLNTMQLDAGDDTFTNYFRYMIYNSNVATNLQPIRSGEWVRLSVPWASMLESVTGSPSRSAVTAVRLQAADKNSTPVTIHLGGIGTYNDYSPTYPNGVISITFDDSYDSQWTKVLPEMSKRGFRGTLYPIIGRLDQPGGYLTTAQVKAFQDRYGWEIGAHAPDDATHTDWTALTEADLEDIMQRMRRWQQQNGIKSNVAAYPQGVFNATVESHVARYYRSCSAIAGRKLNKQPSLPYRLGRYGMSGTTALSQFTTIVDQVKAGQGWADFGGHQLIDSGTPTSIQWLTSDFISLLDYIQAAGVAVAPVGEVLGLAAAGVAAPDIPTRLTQGVLDRTYLAKPTSSAIRGTLARNTQLQNISTIPALASGRLTLVAIELKAGEVITGIAFGAGSTGATTPTNQWFALYDGSLNLLRTTSDDTTTAWAANNRKALNLTSSYTVPTDGTYYVGVCVVAATVPTLCGALHTGSVFINQAPMLAGYSTTGLTNPASAPATAAALTAFSAIPMAQVF